MGKIYELTSKDVDDIIADIIENNEDIRNFVIRMES